MKIPKVDLHPFTKVAWKTKELKEIWAERILRVARAYNNAEYSLVKSGVRPCAVVHIDWYNADTIIEKITTDGLVYLPIRWSKKYQGFSHKHFFTQKGDPESFIYGVLSNSLESAKQFREAELNNKVDHKRIGELLAYPECCINAFNKRWGDGIIDPLFEAAEVVADKREVINGGTEVIYAKSHPYANPFLRYFGIRITSHLPCSIQCKETIEIGEAWIKAMRESDEEAADWAVEILSMPVKWNILKGIAQVETPLFFGITNTVFTEHKKEVILNG